MTTETHAILYQSADGTLSLGMKCKTPECAAESVPLFEGAQVLGTVALLPEPVSGMSYRLAAQPPKAEKSDEAAQAEFTEYFVKNYPGPDTIINAPHWHAPRIFRAAKRALQGTATAAADWTDDAVNYGNALNEAAWVFIEECPEKSALLFNNTKKPLRAAILKYAEVLDAARNQEGGNGKDV